MTLSWSQNGSATPKPFAWSYSGHTDALGHYAEAGYLGADGMLHCYSSRWPGERVRPVSWWGTGEQGLAGE